MRNIRKNGLNKSLLVCTVLVFAVITLFVVMSVGQQSAIAEAAEHQTNNMTDFFVGPYGKNSFFRADEGLLIRNDDAIVNYIDKTYFTAPCQKLFIGNRYGYFIYTFDDSYVDDGDWVQTGNMRSIVLGFDIDFSPKGQASTKDAFGYKIEIIFQREFVTLMPNGLGQSDWEILIMAEQKQARQLINSWSRLINIVLAVPFKAVFPIPTD